MARGTSSSRNGGSGGAEREQRTYHRSSTTGGGASDSRVSRSYRSPPPSSRPSEHRSRRDSSTPPPPSSSSCLSSFYRERFGSHSPEDYLNLRLSQFEAKMGKEHIRGVLEREFRHLAPFEIKIVRNPEDDERLAYVNFEKPECAKSVRRSLLPRLQKMLGRNIGVDPAGVIRDQEGKFIPDRYNRAVMAAADRSPTGGGAGGGGGGGGGGAGGPMPLRRAASPLMQQPRRPPPRRMEMPVFHLNQDDSQAGRTIFVGNLPGDVRDTELRRLFEAFGTVEEVDIKLLADSNAAYAFVLFETVEQALSAREGQHNKPMRPGEYRCQLGYGKTQPCTSLIIGGLGPWASEDMLDKSFYDYGEIASIQYDGGTHAFIRFTEQTAATEACTGMKNFPLGGDDKCITVDYAKDEKKDEERRANAARKRPYDAHHNTMQAELAEAKRARLRTPSPSQSPTRVGCFDSYFQLRETVPCTWKGVLMLKKSDYPLNFYRVFGREHLVQEFLRDSDGASLRLSINQRLPVVNDLYTKMVEYDRTQLALMFATERDKPCEPLVKYLQEKNAAGVISVPGAVLYVLTHTPITEKIVKFFTPRLCPLLTPTPNHLIMVLKLTAQPTLMMTSVNSVIMTSTTATAGGAAAAAAPTSYGLLSATMAPPSLVEVKNESAATAGGTTTTTLITNNSSATNAPAPNIASSMISKEKNEDEAG